MQGTTGNNYIKRSIGMIITTGFLVVVIGLGIELILYLVWAYIKWKTAKLKKLTN